MLNIRHYYAGKIGLVSYYKALFKFLNNLMYFQLVGFQCQTVMNLIFQKRFQNVLGSYQKVSFLTVR